MSLTAPAVEVAGLVKRYAGRSVVDGISFRVDRGEVLALLGPNGAGKTTTVEIVEGYRSADAGSVRVLGEDPGLDRAQLRARVGLMLQGGGGIDPRATPAELLRLHARFHVPPRDPRELLELVGLHGVASVPARRLSGGERQRLGLALALVGRPEVLILDEPTAGMDPAVRATTRELIAGLRSAGAAVLLTTHDLADVDRLADRVAVLAHGRLVATGSPGSLAAEGHAAIRLRLTSPAPPGLAQALAAQWPEARVELEDGARDRLRVVGVTPEPALVARIAAWAVEAGVLVAELRAGSGTLEERYLELTGNADGEHEE